MPTQRAACALLLSATAIAQAPPPRVDVILSSSPAAVVRARGAPPRRLPGKPHEAPITGGVLDLSAAGARLDFGPDQALGIGRGESFTLELSIRTRDAGFSTPLMCRARDGAVHYSLVIGRRPGAIVFETWRWDRNSVVAATRIDDGAWHRIQAGYDALSRRMALLVDGRLQAARSVEGQPLPPATTLRLGNNLGAEQPFTGELRGVRMLGSVAADVADALALERHTRILDPAGVEAGEERWLARHRAPRRPGAATRDEWQQTARGIRAGTQDALGLWPPPYSAAEPRLAGRPSSLSGGPLRSTDFAGYTPALALDVQRGGVLERDGYRVTRVYRQTIAGYFASATSTGRRTATAARDPRCSAPTDTGSTARATRSSRRAASRSPVKATSCSPSTRSTSTTIRSVCRR